VKLSPAELASCAQLAALVLQRWGGSACRLGMRQGIDEQDRVFYIDFLGCEPALSELQELLKKLKPGKCRFFVDVAHGCRIICEYLLGDTGYTYQVILPITAEPGEAEPKIVRVYNISAVHLPEGRGTRIYFRIFNSEEEVRLFEQRLKELEQADHRFIGQKLDLFSFQEELIGSGLPLFHPYGTRIRNKLIELIRKINRALGFDEVFTPHLWKVDVVKVSGHYDKYKENMFIFSVGDEEYTLKPMNCPGHILIFKSRERSYEELPVRYAEFATVYRNEIPGALRGLLRVRALTQDDHHVFARIDQVEQEVLKLVYAIMKLYQFFGFQEVRINLSTRPDNFIGSVDLWEQAETALKTILEKIKTMFGVEYYVKEKEGAFYGPKIDFDVKDSLGRWWQLGTIQLDFFQPANFGAYYTAKAGKKELPVIIHCAMLGSIERFMAVLLETTRGRLPAWLAPVQAAVIPVASRHAGYARAVATAIEEAGYYALADLEERTVNYKVRKYEDLKVPYILVVGDKEMQQQTVSVRKKGEKKTEEMPLESFIDLLRQEDKKIVQLVAEIKEFVQQLNNQCNQ